MTINNYIYPSIIGSIRITTDDQSILSVLLTNEICNENQKKTPLVELCVSQIEEYLHGVRSEFDLTIQPVGTAFQKKVWSALQQIPCGETRTYKEVAILIGNENASRAVGMANNKNPLHIIVPCHRVVGSDGSLVGYAAGLDKKRWLLEHERTHMVKI